MLAMEKRLGMLGEPYKQGEAGTLRQAREGVHAGGAALLARSGRKSRAAAVAGGALVLAGEVALRWSVFKAGFQSARDPKYTVEPRARAREPRPGRYRPCPRACPRDLARRDVGRNRSVRICVPRRRFMGHRSPTGPVGRPRNDGHGLYGRVPGPVPGTGWKRHGRWRGEGRAPTSRRRGPCSRTRPDSAVGSVYASPPGGRPLSGLRLVRLGGLRRRLHRRERLAHLVE